jgi:hypothetical protein
MVDRNRDSNRWYNQPWAYSTGSAVLAGLVVLYAGKLKPLWVGLAAAAFVVVGSIVFSILKAFRAWREHRLLQTAVAEKLGWLHDELQWLALLPAVREAEALGWSIVVNSDGRGMVLTSPSGHDVYAEPTLLQADQLAKRLHAADPQHFPGEWEPWVEYLTKRSELRLGELEARVQQLQDAPKNAARLREISQQLAEQRADQRQDDAESRG